MPFLARHDGAVPCHMDLPVPRHKANPFPPHHRIAHQAKNPARAVRATGAPAQSLAMAARGSRAVETKSTAASIAVLNRSAAGSSRPRARLSARSPAFRFRTRAMTVETAVTPVYWRRDICVAQAARHPCIDRRVLRPSRRSASATSAMCPPPQPFRHQDYPAPGRVSSQARTAATTCRNRSPPRLVPPYQRVTTTTWSASPSRSSIRRIVAPAPASPSSFRNGPLSERITAQLLWVALAKRFPDLSRARKASTRQRPEQARPKRHSATPDH